MLRLPRMRDATSLFHAYMSDIDGTRHLLWRPHESPETTRLFLASTTVAWAEREGHRPWVIEERGHAAPSQRRWGCRPTQHATSDHTMMIQASDIVS